MSILFVLLMFLLVISVRYFVEPKASPAMKSEIILSCVRFLGSRSSKAGIGGIGTHSLRHTYKSWLDSVGTPVGVQQKLMRHSDIRTTMNIYGDAVSQDMVTAQAKVVRLAMPSS